MQPAPRCDGSYAVTRSLGPALLRLEQIDVSAARNVERMPARTEPPALLARERQLAAADGAEEHGSSVADGEPEGGKSARPARVWARRPSGKRAIRWRPT